MFRFLRCHTKTLYQNVVVEFLDGSKNTFIVNARVKGSDLIVEVCRYLHLKETEYFGLQRVDSKTGKMHWINEFRSIRSQVSDDQLLYLKIRFYPPALNSILDDQETIQQFYLQSLLNVVRGDFKVPSSSICLATSYIAQAQLGDHDETQSYAELLQNAELTPELTLKIKDLHQSIKGTPKDICQIRFLEMLLSCPLFGVKLHKAVNDKNEDCYIGINSKAEFLLVMSDLIILRFPEWPKIKLQCKFPINRFRKQTSELDVLLQYEHDKFITSHSIVDDLVDQYKFCVSRSALMAPFRFPLCWNETMIESLSRRALSGSSGTYHVHALELAAAREHKLKGLNVTVMFLDDTERTFHVDKRAKGSVLLDQVYQHLELVEKDYFGLQFSEKGCLPTNKCMRWLDPSKYIKKQLGNCQCPLFFRVKFYVSDPSKLQEEYTRYQFYLQVRRDIIEERLHLLPSTACLLASYTVQSELGDYQPDEHGPNYLSHLQLVPGQSDDMEKKISELHKLHKGQLPADAEFNFLDHAKRIEMYGVELHRAKDSANKDIELGVTSVGLVVFQNKVRINTFSWSKIMKISFKRKQFFIQLRRELSENYDTILGFNMETYRSSKTLWKACVEHHTFFRLHSPKIRRRFPLLLGSKFYYSGRTEFQTVSEVKQRGRLERKFVRSPSKHLVRRAVSLTLEEKGKSLPVPSRASRPYDNKVTSLGAKEPRKAWEDDLHLSDDDGGFLERTLEGPFSPGLAGRVLSYADEEPASPTTNELYDTPPYSVSHSPTSQMVEEGLVTIVLHPDEDGKYGFNVKGGANKDIPEARDLPILVSRVAPNTPADRCNPRLSEGDQVLQINNHDVTHAHHQTVVQLIQDARSTNDGKLVLVIKPNMLYSGEEYEEPPYQYVPVGEVLRTPSPTNALEESMLLLADGIASGALISQYELLYRKHPDLTCDEAVKPKNINKNRYRDISPYDSSRVILKNGSNGDYINANYINMHINGTDVINHYIATQGPLQSTADDFWQMILEEECTHIIMLTTIVERGRAKCHKYWPNTGETLTFPNVVIKCSCEETDDSGSFVFRDFILSDVKNNTERTIKHMQYVAWPDHGVPDSSGLFLSFTERVQEARRESSAPLVVHCSAGIGRTGVLILMETAMCLIEASEPVYPLDIVQTMREQRAMMIQNASQYRFVCESVHAAYVQKNVEPRNNMPR